MAVNRTSAAKAAQKLLSAHSSDVERVPVRAIARAAGCVVKLTPLDDDLSGMAFLKDGMRAIVVNSLHHPNRQRFTIAHELGHRQLHLPMLHEGVHVDKAIYRRDQHASKGVEPYEMEANHFAAELLMPKKVLLQHVGSDFDLQDDQKLAALAAVLGVSTAALSFRIQNVFGT